MVEYGTQRKLAAILSTDIKGCGQLMGDDDESTVNTIRSCRKIIADLIYDHQRRVVDTPGDYILAEFGSALNAVLSAIEIRRSLKTVKERMTDDRRMVFRIGINLGDIIHKDDRNYGDGVNLATRKGPDSFIAHSIMPFVYSLAGPEEKERTPVVVDRISNFKIENSIRWSFVDGY